MWKFGFVLKPIEKRFLVFRTSRNAISEQHILENSQKEVFASSSAVPRPKDR
jgi:hypothetical protein